MTPDPTEQRPQSEQLPESLRTYTDYQKGGLDYRAWLRYEIALMVATTAAPGDRLETEHERGMQEAFSMVIKQMGEMLLEPLPNPMADAARDTALRQLEGPDPLKVPVTEEAFPFQEDGA